VLRTGLCLLKALSLKGAECLGDIVEEAAVDQLVHSERAAAVGTLLLRLSYPLFEACAARELAAARAHHRLVQLAVADKAL
jgi:hypothetical protein